MNIVEKLEKELDGTRENCETCGSEVGIHFGVEGTNSYTPREFNKNTRALLVAVNVLEKITRKVPEKVSSAEAADMACEFKIGAKEALTQIREILK